jgi:hypothetical protein
MGTNLAHAPLDFRELEGHRVNLSLTNGSQLKGVEVVSAGHGGLVSLWLEQDGTDVFIKKEQILGVDKCDINQAE